MNDSDGNEQRRQIIKGKWEQESSERANLKEATIRDLVFRDLNTEVVREYLSPEDVVLDIGCGNGFATAEYARVTQHMLGVDYMRGFIEAANHLHQSLIEVGKLEFRVGDALQLDLGRTFSKVISERLLINLPSISEQIAAGRQVYNALDSGGVWLLTEATVQVRDAINQLRAEFGIEPLYPHPHNVFLDERAFEAGVQHLYTIEAKLPFGFFSLVSRVIYAATVKPEEPECDALMNKITAKLAKRFMGEEFPAHVTLYVLRKKG